MMRRLWPVKRERLVLVTESLLLFGQTNISMQMTFAIDI